MPLTVDIEAGQSAHSDLQQAMSEEQAKNVEAEASLTVTDVAGDEEVPVSHHEIQAPTVGVQTGVIMDSIECTMGFKMPIATYHMLEYRVTRRVHYVADPNEDHAEEVFKENMDWVDLKLNQLVAAQQKHQKEQEMAQKAAMAEASAPVPLQG